MDIMSGIFIHLLDLGSEPLNPHYLLAPTTLIMHLKFCQLNV